MEREAKYWRSEYENLRRKKNKEIEKMKLKQARMCHKTFDFLKLLGVPDDEILMFYKNYMKDEE